MCVPMLETEYYDKQTTSAAPIQFLGIFVAIIMAVGQQFRRHEYHVCGRCAALERDRHSARARLLAGQHSASFFFESVLLAGLGGLIGCLLVLPLNGFTTGIGNFTTFSETSFNLR